MNAEVHIAFEPAINWLAAINNKIGSSLAAALEESAELVYEYAVENAPMKTGKLKNSIKKKVVLGSHPHASVWTSDKKAQWMEFGTRPHTITPKNGKFLRFQAGGRTVFARVVHHPGTKATHFMKRALVEQDGMIKNIFARAIANAIRTGS